MGDVVLEEVLRRVDALVAQARPEEAAIVAAQGGLHERAAALFEQACDFARASDQASLAGDARRALALAALAGDAQRMDQAQEALLLEPNRARAAAEELRARGHGAVSARLLERLGDLQDAARAYAEAGLPVPAADAYEAMGQVREAARVLEAAHRADPSDHNVALRLARLLVSHRRFDAAVRLLQTLPESSPWQETALPLLASSYEALGLDQPADQARRKAATLGLTSQPTGHDAPATQVVYGRYELLRSVASTPSAQVFEALDRLTNQHVAVKQLRTQSLMGAGRDAFERLTREARALAQLRHANVVPLVELVDRGGAIVTPWMAGGSVADLMERERITPARAVEIAASVLAALSDAHRLGILHRDVKPSNILFDDAGVARLADFGAAHVSDTSSTATAGVIGTLAYMSPEQRYGQPATPASDVFGVGATLVEMLTGQPPSLSGQLPRAPSMCHPDLDVAHDAMVFRLIAHDVEDRVPDALEARKALLALYWPTENRGDALVRPSLVDSREEGDRLSVLDGDVALDRWLGRRVLRVADSAMMRRVVQAHASVAEPGLSAVLRFDPEEGTFWFEVPDGARLSETARPLCSWEAELLSVALGALHRRGVAHGSVDASHIVLRDGFPVLLFEPETVSGASPEQDMASLRRLCG
jgi:serine/threonine-protein kinase